MRDEQWIAAHRGGLLAKEQHRQLVVWAARCAKRVLWLLGDDINEPLMLALHVADEWAVNKATTGAAMRAAQEAHAVARDYTSPVSTAVARAVGHAVATAHMADHAPGAALYALMALKLAGEPSADEQQWQLEQLQLLPASLVQLVTDAMVAKGQALKVY